MSVKKRPDGKWRARYRDAAGKEHARHFDRKTDADKWEKEQVTAVNRGTHIDPKASKVTFKDYAEAWRLSQHHHRQATARAIEQTFRLHVYEFIGSARIGLVTPTNIRSMVQTWVDAGAAPRTIHQRAGFVSAVFRAAVRDGVLARNPCDGVSKPTIEKSDVRALETAELARFVDAMPNHLRALVIVGAGAGPRISEALGLTVDRVNFLGRTVTVDRQVDRTPPYALVPVKNSRRTPTRTIPVPAYVTDALSGLAGSPGPDGRLFHDSGKILSAREVGPIIRQAADDAGLPDATFHALRHTFASTLLDQGVPVNVVADYLGDRPETVLRTYAHAIKGVDDRARGILAGLFTAEQDHEDGMRTVKIVDL